MKANGSDRAGRLSDRRSPPNVKVRAFVSETEIAKIHYGDQVKVFLDGQREPLIGKVSFISPQVEYTPPVIYSLETRCKLVIMVE